MTGLWYQLVINTLGPPVAALASLKGRFGGRWGDRLGLTPRRAPVYGHPRLWFHAASVGEAKVAAGVIEPLLALNPSADIFLSLGTPAGLAEAEKLFSGETRVTVMAAPLDFWGSPGRALDRIKPRVLVIMETELWPNLIFAAKKRGVGLMMGAARMTGRSFRRYKLASGFINKMLKSFDFIATADQTGAERYTGLGAVPERLRVMGTPKFDRLLTLADSPGYQKSVAAWRERLWGGSAPSGPLLVAGSTHEGEDELILKAAVSLREKHPSLKLILAPRHLGRSGRVLELAGEAGLSAALAGQTRPPLLAGREVLVLDVMGELLAVYALADLALVGGSLGPGLMGHNPLEPAAAGVMTMFGPQMESFSREAAELIQGNGAVQTGPETLAADLSRWLADAEARIRVAEAGRGILHRRQPAGPRLAQAALDLL